MWACCAQDQYQALLNHQYNHPQWFKDMQPYWDVIPPAAAIPKLHFDEALLPLLQEERMVRPTSDLQLQYLG